MSSEITIHNNTKIETHHKTHKQFMPIPAVAIAIPKLVAKIKKLSGTVENIDNIKKLGLMKQKVAGLSRKEQVKTIFTSDEFKKLKEVLNNDELYKHFENEIETRLQRSFKFSNTNQHIFTSEQELFRYITEKDPNANIMLLMETTNVDLYEIEMRVLNEMTEYSICCASVVGIDLKQILGNNHTITTKNLYAVLKREEREEDTVMFKFGQWLKKNYAQQRVVKSELKKHAVKFFNIKAGTFYARIGYVKRKMFRLDNDKKHYYIAIAKSTWDKENSEQIQKEMLEQFKNQMEK